MKLLLPVDGSKYSKKAIAFLATHENLLGATDEVVVLNVQAAVPPEVKRMLGATAVKQYHEAEAVKVIAPIEVFLKRHKLNYSTQWVVGSPSEEIVKAAQKTGAHMVVMGTHGHGLLGRALMGSVAQRVVTHCDVPVLLVK